jgi:hypothetical protein
MGGKQATRPLGYGRSSCCDAKEFHSGAEAWYDMGGTGGGTESTLKLLAIDVDLTLYSYQSWDSTTCIKRDAKRDACR